MNIQSVREVTHGLIQSKWAYPWLFVLAFLENTILLLTIEPLFIPVMAARRKEIPFIAATLVAGCLAGALCTYFLAASLYEPWIEPLLAQSGLLGQMESVRGDIAENGFWAMFVIGVTPIPFQLGTVASGVLNMALPIFIAAVVLSRSIRYFGLGLLVMWIGRRAETFIQNRELEIMGAFLILFLIIAAVAVLM